MSYDQQPESKGIDRGTFIQGFRWPTTILLAVLYFSQFVRQALADEPFRDHLAFSVRRTYIFEQVIKLLLKQGEPAEALHYVEQAKAQSLYDALDVARKRTSKLPDTASRTTAQLLADWPPGIAAIDYFLGSENAWVFSVDTLGTVQVWDLLVDGRTSLNMVVDVRRVLDEVGGAKQDMFDKLSRHEAYDHGWQDRLHRLRSTLIPTGLLKTLQAADTVVIVPHHILHYFPFAALVTQQDNRTRDAPMEMVQPKFLIDEPFDLIFAPSLSVWDLLRSRPNDKLEHVAGVGIANALGQEPLLGVQADLENLKETFGDAVDSILLETDATESHVRELFANSGMLMLAMHGNNQAAQPLESFLACQKDEDNNGRLTTAEILAADIRPALVVISACNSGLAEKSPMPGDDLLCPPRAFLQSGARTVVSALWDVDDGAGPALMKGFFKRLAEGGSAGKALAQSQRTLVKNGRSTDDDPWVHPYFWAGFTAAGDDRTRFEKLFDGN